MQRHVEAERLRGLQVNDELDFARLLNGQIARVGALQNLVNVEGRAPQTIRNIDAVAHERSIHRPFPRPSDDRPPSRCRQPEDALSLRNEDGARNDDEGLRASVRQARDCRVYFGWASHLFIDFLDLVLRDRAIGGLAELSACRIRGIRQKADAPQLWQDGDQQLEVFRRNILDYIAAPDDHASGMRKALCKSSGYRISGCG